MMKHFEFKLIDAKYEGSKVYLAPNAVEAQVIIPKTILHLPEKLKVTIDGQTFLYPTSHILHRVKRPVLNDWDSINESLFLVTPDEDVKPSKKIMLSPPTISPPRTNSSTPKKVESPVEIQQPKTVKYEIDQLDSIALDTFKFGKTDALSLDDVDDDDFDFFKATPTQEIPPETKPYSSIFSPQYYSAATPYGFSPSPRIDASSPMMSTAQPSPESSPACQVVLDPKEAFRSPQPTSPFYKMPTPKFISIHN
jgi:hypothetical protein